MATEAPETTGRHGGRLATQRLKAFGVSRLFTLSGAHIFPFYDGAKEDGIELLDTRHEQTAAFAAEGWAKATREVGVCALTAGPGVTNGMSAMASALQNSSPMLVLGGRSPSFRWGQGALQEIDHVPFCAPLTRYAATAHTTAEIPERIDEAMRAAAGQPSGPAFVDFPIDQVFSQAEVDVSADASLPDPRETAAAEGVERAVELLRGAERPVAMAGTGVYWARAENELLGLVEELGIPVFLNGLARGCVPADHRLFFSRARGSGLKDADVALVIGVPMDFRLGFGGAFGDDTKIVMVGSTPPESPPAREVAAELYGGVARTLDAIREGVGQAVGRSEWLTGLRDTEQEKRDAEREDLGDDRAPLHPVRVYRELNEVIDRSTVVVGDGGDFVSFAGKLIDTFEPGTWMDPGPYGCLGAGPGYAIAAQLANPGRRVCLLLGDGAFGFAGMEFDTMVRHGLPVVGVMGNNGIWALEKHPMEFLYGYSVAAELQERCRYDQVVEALGGHGELVERPDQLKPALERAFASGKPALVNVLTDPSVVYPRKSTGV